MNFCIKVKPSKSYMHMYLNSFVGSDIDMYALPSKYVKFQKSALAGVHMDNDLVCLNLLVNTSVSSYHPYIYE